MATYEELYGKRVKDFDSDPTLESSYEGQVWYDKSTGVLKSVISFGAFASAANMGTARYGHGATGEVSSIIANGGTTGSGTAVSEEYNGSGWGTGGSMNTTRFYISDFGNSQTAAVAVNGRSPGETFMNDVEEYNGTSWTTATDTPYNSNNTNTFGILTAGVAAGGNNSSAPVTQTVAEYDGTNWTAGTSLPSTMRESIVGGTQTAGFVASGGPGPSDNVNHFQYDGTNWTTAGNVNTQRQSAASGGTQTYAIGASGYDNPLQYLTSSSVWDGSSWAAGATVAVGRYASGKGSTSSGTSDVFCGGQTFVPPSSYPNPGATEEYNFSINTVTAAAWASGGNLNTARYQMAGAGTQTAGLAFGGYTTTAVGDTEEYNGTSWSEQSDLGTARYEMANGNGTQTAGLCIAGRTSPGAQSFVEEYNGSSWSEVNNLPSNRVAQGSCGPQTATVAALGATAPGAPNITNTSFEYDGTNWTAGNTANTARSAAFAAGTQTSAIFAGGSPSLTAAEEYNGTSFANTGSLLVGAQGANAAGADSDAALFTSGGNGTAPSGVDETQSYDGSTFSTAPKLASKRGYAAGFGTQTAAVVGGGLRTAGVATTEDFTGETSAVSFKTLTTS